MPGGVEGDQQNRVCAYEHLMVADLAKIARPTCKLSRMRWSCGAATAAGGIALPEAGVHACVRVTAGSSSRRTYPIEGASSPDRGVCVHWVLRDNQPTCFVLR